MKFYALIALNGLSLAALYFIVACGFSLIFGLLRTVNLAHGAFYLVGAYVSYEAGARSGNWYVGLAAGAVVTAVVGIVTQATILKRTGGDSLRQALLTIALAIVLADLLLWRYGGLTYQLEAPQFLLTTIQFPIAGPFPAARVLVIVAALVIGVALWSLLNLTKLGIAIRAGVDDRVMLAALGVNVNTLYVVVFGLGAFLAGTAGTIGGTVYSISPGEDARFLLSSLIVVIVGGLGSLGGTALGALLVGLAEQFGLALFPSYAIALTFGLMVGVLAIRPHGLVGRR